MDITWLVHATAVVLSIVVLFPSTTLGLQALLALFPRTGRFRDLDVRRVKTVVLIPAHNEDQRIHRTIRSVLSDQQDVSVLVVADNCSDDTAECARRAGAQVVERTNQQELGKAYALGFGAKHLAHDPPDVVVVVDADCLIGGKGVSRIAQIADKLGRPVQSLNVIDRRRNSDSHTILSTLGNRLHNIVRPLGNARLGLPCQLMGSGMAFPWQVVRDVGLQNASLAEDKQLGIDVALAGYAPVFCLETKVASHLPDRMEGYLGQRTRWEHGHLLAAMRAEPKLVAAAIARGDVGLLALAVDLAVPPIAIIAVLWFASLLLSLASGGINGHWLPLQITCLAAALLAATALITWAGFARRRVPFRALLSLPIYVLKKLPIYLSLLVRGPQRVWLRTDRSSDHPPKTA